MATKKRLLIEGQIRVDDKGERVLIGYQAPNKLWPYWCVRAGAWYRREPRTEAVLLRRYPKVESRGNAVPTTRDAMDLVQETKAARERASVLERHRHVLAQALLSIRRAERRPHPQSDTWIGLLVHKDAWAGVEAALTEAGINAQSDSVAALVRAFGESK
ncbi:hypothetical protein MYSTI_01942 [Myxococcus stipitatus DSM 14675]|uniref:Uncharacterized protein n=1 Tax=Myxococcus stipitatus (strain DSM 14675 / JCM 12634 / Mx s8) TaxID=1278073 RepID=L7U556_MYXSD|nr:hypothetical protein [Myxococcus stipitatus]AGC43273.1 hypothetical protein MYSTI_01942 [Myxococcus stipitatus DSM 14675]